MLAPISNQRGHALEHFRLLCSEPRALARAVSRDTIYARWPSSRYEETRNAVASWSLLICLGLGAASAAGAPPEEVLRDERWQGQVTSYSNAAGGGACDFAAGTCKVSEGDLLEFTVGFNGPAGSPVCTFVNPVTLPSGATFAAEKGIGTVSGTFRWQPHECQAGVYVVHFHVNFVCFNLARSGLIPVTITVNDTLPCEETGSCCLSDGQCVDNVASEQCVQNDGVFRGQDTVCVSIAGSAACPNRQGACCKPDGTCIDTTSLNCTVYLFGEFLNPGTRCDQTDPPIVCTGACCLDDFTCVDGKTYQECHFDAEGEYRGAGTACGPDSPCSGACCFADGNCFHLPSKQDCENRLGVFQGRDTECANQGGNITCPFTGGACCKTNPPTCRETDRLRCTIEGDRYAAHGQHCPTPTTCAIPVGACCEPTDIFASICRDGLTQNECAQLAFGTARYQGDGTVCTDSDSDGVHDCDDQCPNTPAGEPIQTAPFSDRGCSCTQMGAAVSPFCNDFDPCTDDLCDPRSPGADEKGCIHRPRLKISDNIPCTIDECNAITGEATHTPDHTRCDDNDACTTDVCTTVAGCINNAITCEDDGIVCTVDRCDPTLGCNYPDHSACEDVNQCTANFCEPNSAPPSTGCVEFPVSCDDGVPCTLDSCEPAEGCDHFPRHSFCDDNDPCTQDLCNPDDADAAPDGCTNTLIKSLRPCGKGDVNDDGITDINDLPGYTACLDRSGPGTFVDEECARADRNGNGCVDLFDTAVTQKYPFICDPQQCHDQIDGKCATRCVEPEVCVPDDGGQRPSDNQELLHTPIDGTVATGGDPECKRACTSLLDCFNSSKCEDCVTTAEGQFCVTRCDPMRCEDSCDGAGNCPSRCNPDTEKCLDGECRRRCLIDADCDAFNCLVCRDGACVSDCAEEEVCVRVSNTKAVCGARCGLDTDCPDCHYCLARFGCAPCQQPYQICVDGRCRRKCSGPDDCDVACQNCVDGVCVNNCPEGEVCAFGACRSGCRDSDDCGACEICGSYGEPLGFCYPCPDDLFCMVCDEAENCRFSCNVDACEQCDRAGKCILRCVEGHVCDGSGNCVPEG